MSRKRFSLEGIVSKLGEVDLWIAKGWTVAQACKRVGVTA